jgi:hypothetical protein
MANAPDLVTTATEARRPLDAGVQALLGFSLAVLMALGFSGAVLSIAVGRPGIAPPLAAALAFLVGGVQLVYVVPLFVYLRRRGRGAFSSGLAWGAAMVLWLNLLFIVAIWNFPSFD